VLCEKPFTVNAREAEEVIQEARQHKLFLMEAVWNRYFPLMKKLYSLLDEGVIGEVRHVYADFGFRMDVDPDAWVFDLKRGGGALLDVGMYPLNLASLLLGKPESVLSTAHLGETGVDEDAAIVLDYGAGKLAVCTTALRTQTPWEATLMGTEGIIRIHTPWWRPTKMTLTKPDWSSETFEIPFEGNGYNYEAAEVMRCLRGGRLESALMPLDETLAVMGTMDTIRQQWHLSYPADQR